MIKDVRNTLPVNLPTVLLLHQAAVLFQQHFQVIRRKQRQGDGCKNGLSTASLERGEMALARYLNHYFFLPLYLRVASQRRN